MSDLVEALKAIHPKIETPRHGCCASPKLCEGHVPECGGRDHGYRRPRWPCPTMELVLAEEVSSPHAAPEAERSPD